MKETKLELKESNKKLSKIENQNEELLDIDMLKDANQLIKTKLNISTKDRVINPVNKSKLENFIICKSKLSKIDYRYYVIRCQQKYTASKLNRLKEQKYITVLKIDNITNGIKFWNHCKEQLKINLEINSNHFNLENITEDVFIKKINEFYENRKNIELSECSEED